LHVITDRTSDFNFFETVSLVSAPKHLVAVHMIVIHISLGSSPLTFKVIQNSEFLCLALTHIRRLAGVKVDQNQMNWKLICRIKLFDHQLDQIYPHFVHVTHFMSAYGTMKNCKSKLMHFTECDIMCIVVLVHYMCCEQVVTQL